jgi:hypothetical protein
MRFPKMRGLKVAAIVSLVLAAVFIVFGGVSHGYSLKSVLALGVSGAFIGAIAAPEFEPKAFPYPVLWQVCVTVVGFLAAAVYFDAGTDGFALAVVGGVVVGYLAPYWINHIDVP